MKLLAERLAYEAVIAGQVGQAGQASLRPQQHAASARLQDLVEVHRKLSFLEKKLTNPDFDMDSLTPLDFYTSLLAEKLVVQGEVAWSLAGPKTSSSNTSVTSSGQNSSKTNPALTETCRDLEARLLEREKRLAALITRFKDAKLREIAVVMAKETVTGEALTSEVRRKGDGFEHLKGQYTRV